MQLCSFDVPTLSITSNERAEVRARAKRHETDMSEHWWPRQTVGGDAFRWSHARSGAHEPNKSGAGTLPFPSNAEGSAFGAALKGLRAGTGARSQFRVGDFGERDIHLRWCETAPATVVAFQVFQASRPVSHFVQRERAPLRLSLSLRPPPGSFGWTLAHTVKRRQPAAPSSNRPSLLPLLARRSEPATRPTNSCPPTNVASS